MPGYHGGGPDPIPSVKYHPPAWGVKSGGTPYATGDPYAQHAQQVEQLHAALAESRAFEAELACKLELSRAREAALGRTVRDLRTQLDEYETQKSKKPAVVAAAVDGGRSVRIKLVPIP